jgi:hypothetical protein
VTTANDAGPFTRPEAAAAIALIALGVVTAAARHVYDAGTWPMAASLTVLGVLASIVLLGLGLRALEIPSGQGVAAAVWATVPANVFLLSQIAYIGFFFIPLEIVASALILRIRARVPGWWAVIGLATAARIGTLGLVYLARPVARTLFPWR